MAKTGTKMSFDDLLVTEDSLTEKIGDRKFYSLDLLSNSMARFQEDIS